MNAIGTLIVGIGSPHGDDAVGWKVADFLGSEPDRYDARVKKVVSPIEMLEWLDGVQQLILCDACRGLGHPGEIRRWPWPAAELVQVTWSGTHDFSLVASLQLADVLDRLPRHVVIWTVEAAKGRRWDGMSPEVSAAIPRLSRLIARELVPFLNAKNSACTNNQP